MSDQVEQVQIEVDPTDRAYQRIGMLTKQVDVKDETITQLLQKLTSMGSELAKYKAAFGLLEEKDSGEKSNPGT